MSRIKFFDPDVKMTVLRASDGDADVKLRIKAEDATIEVNVGHWQDNVQELRDTLAAVMKTLDDDILDGWQDTPEQNDGYVTFDDGAYHVSLDGKPVGHGFPSRDIAVYELARASVKAGYFPNMWEQHERGTTEPINDMEQFFADDGGLAPLDGVKFMSGDRVTTPGDLTWTVDQDYGHLGVTLFAPSDSSIRMFVNGNDPTQAVTQDSLTLEEDE